MVGKSYNRATRQMLYNYHRIEWYSINLKRKWQQQSSPQHEYQGKLNCRYNILRRILVACNGQTSLPSTENQPTNLVHFFHKITELVSYLAKDQSHRHGIHIPCTPLWQWIPTASIININPTVQLILQGM